MQEVKNYTDGDIITLNDAPRDKKAKEKTPPPPPNPDVTIIINYNNGKSKMIILYLRHLEPKNKSVLNKKFEGVSMEDIKNVKVNLDMKERITGKEFNKLTDDLNSLFPKKDRENIEFILKEKDVK